MTVTPESLFYKRNRHLGRNDHPAQFAVDVIVHDFNDELGDKYEGMLLKIWSSSEWPEKCVDPDIWLNMFKMGERSRLVPSYISESKTKTLYRGSVEDRKIGMSWTDSIDIATWFATRFGVSFGKPALWKIEAPAELILAKNDSRGEHEWILDTSEPEQLDIKRIQIEEV